MRGIGASPLVSACQLLITAPDLPSPRALPLPGSRDYEGIEEELLPEAKSIISRNMARGVLN